MTGFKKLIKKPVVAEGALEGSSVTDKKPPAHARKSSLWTKIGLGLLLVVAFIAPFVFSGFGQELLIRVFAIIGLYIILALGLNILVGYAGQLDFGRIAFYAVGAYAGMIVGMLVSEALPASIGGLSFLIALVAGVAAAVVLGLILSLAVLRLRGDYLTIVTLGFGEIVRIAAQNNILGLTNGASGVPAAGKNLPAPVGLEWLNYHTYISLGNNFTFQFSNNVYWYLVILILVVVAIIITRRQENSRTGRAWAALKDDEIAARAMGINTNKTKTSAILMSAIWGGVAGATFAYFQGMVSPESFTFFESILVLAIVVIGGMGSTKGVIIGAIIIEGAPEFIRAFAQSNILPLSQAAVAGVANYRNLVLGLLMIVMMAFRPQGLIPMVRPKRILSSEAQEKIEDVDTSDETLVEAGEAA